MKHYQFCLVFIILLFFVTQSKSEERNESTADIESRQWLKAFIIKDNVTALLPSIIPGESNDAQKQFFYKFLTASVNQDLKNNKLKYSLSKGGTSNSGGISSVKEQSSVVLGKNNVFYPIVWDISSTYLFVEDLRNLSANGNIDEYIKRIPLTNNADINWKCMGIIPYNATFGDDNKYEFRGTIYHQIIQKSDNEILLFLLKDKQFLVWEYSYQTFGELDPILKWEFQYAFKVDRTEPYQICQIKDTLYILFKGGGIYTLDVDKAKKQKISAPKVALNEKRPYSLNWVGFTTEEVKEKSISAKQISPLDSKAFVVDKDHDTAYFQAGDYFFEVTDLAHCVKMPELRENLETFEDKEADRMRAALLAIDLLKKSPMKSPDPKTIMKTQADNNDENEAKNANNTAANDDDDESADDKTDSGNGNDHVTAAGNSGASASKVGDKDDGKDSAGNTADSKAVIDSGNIDKNVPDSGSKSDEISDSTDVFTYVSISAGILILLTVIFLVFTKRKVG